MRRNLRSLGLWMVILMLAVSALPSHSFGEASPKVTIFGNLAPELSEADKRYFEELGKATNTEIEIIVPPSSNYEEALTILLAGGEYPDLVLFPRTELPIFMDSARNGLILPLNEYLAHAPNLTKYSYEISMNTLKVLGDEHIYGIPRTSIARADGIMVRKDWADKLGLDFFEEGKPVTRDQFTQMLDAFTNGDPDGNGVADTFGIGLNTTDGFLDVPGFVAWSYGLQGWQPSEGEQYPYMDPKYSRTNSAYKNALAYTNELWNKRYIDPDWPTLNVDAQNMRFSQGITGMRPEFAGWMLSYERDLKAVHPDASLQYLIGVVDQEGDAVHGGLYGTGFWGAWGVMSTSAHPQKAVEVLDYMLSDAFWDTTVYGVEGTAWTYDGQGNKTVIPDANYRAGRQIVRRNNAPNFFIALDTPEDQRIRLESLIQICIENAMFSINEGFRPPIMDDPLFIDAEKERRTAISKIIVGDLPLSAYDQVLETWYQNGGETYVSQMNEAIAAKRQ